jgi:hypothetical protein
MSEPQSNTREERPEVVQTPLKPADPDPVAEELEARDYERATKWLSEKWGDGKHKCPLCGGEDFNVSGPLALPALRRPLGDAVVPVFGVTCKGCGQMQLLNAMAPKNLLEDEPEKPAEDDGSPEGVDKP